MGGDGNTNENIVGGANVGPVVLRRRGSVRAIVVECCVPAEGLSLPREVVLSLSTHPPPREFLLTAPYPDDDSASHPGLLFWRKCADHN